MFINCVRSERDGLGVLQSDTLTLAEQSALLPNIQRTGICRFGRNSHDRRVVWEIAEINCVSSLLCALLSRPRTHRPSAPQFGFCPTPCHNVNSSSSFSKNGSSPGQRLISRLGTPVSA